MAVQCDRGRIGGRHTGAWCTQAEAVGGPGGHRPKPGPSRASGRFGRRPRDRPKPVRWTGTWRPVNGSGRGRGQTPCRRRTNGRWHEGPPKRDRVAGPEDPGPVSGRSRREERGRHAWVRMKVGKHKPPMGRLGRPSPEGEIGRGRPTDASHGGTPEGGPALRGPMRRPVLAEARGGRSRRTPHGSGGTGPRGL